MDVNLEVEASCSSSGYQSSGTDCSQPDVLAVGIAQPYRCLSVLPGHEGHVFSLTLASDQLVYSGSDCGEIRASRWTDRAGGTQFGSGEGSVKAMVVVGNKVFTAHQDQKIRVWKRSSSGHGQHKLVATLPTVKDYVMTFITPKSSVRVRRHKRALWIDHHDTISVLAVGKGVLYSGSWDKTIKVWRLSDMKCIESIPAHIDAVNALAVDATRGFLYSGSADGTVKVWECHTKSPKHRHRHRHVSVATLAPQKHHSVTALALTPDGTICYAGSSDKCIAVWHRHDEGTGDHMKNVASLRGHHLAVLCLAAATNFHLVSGSADKTIRVWKRDTNLAHQCVAVLQGHSRPVKCLAVKPDAAGASIMLYSGSMDRSVRVWWVSLLDPDAESASATSPSSPDVEFLTPLDSPFPHHFHDQAGLEPVFHGHSLP